MYSIYPFLYQKRKEHVERSFADSKQNHGYRYAMYKGVKKNQHYTWLICAAQNMKNIAIKKSNTEKALDLKSKFRAKRIFFTLKLFFNSNILKPLIKIRGLSTI